MAEKPKSEDGQTQEQKREAKQTHGPQTGSDRSRIPGDGVRGKNPWN